MDSIAMDPTELLCCCCVSKAVLCRLPSFFCSAGAPEPIVLPIASPLQGLLSVKRIASVCAADGDWVFPLSPSWPPVNASISFSLTPFVRNIALNLLFSAATRRAAACISAEANTPSCSQLRYLFSSSWRYSLRRARERRWLSRMRARLDDCYS